MGNYISIWQVELEYELSTPDAPYINKKPYFVAKQRATTYYNQFTSREAQFSEDYEVIGEVLPDAVMLGESNYLDANLSPESRVLFNDLVRQLLFQFVKEFEEEHKDIRPGFASKFVSRLIRMSRLDEILDQDLIDKIQENLGDANPWKYHELATLSGFKVREGNRTPMDFEDQYQRVNKELRLFTKTML